MSTNSKLNKNKANAKLKALTKIVNENPTSSDATNNTFEIELLWCIQQLETLLAENKLNPARSKFIGQVTLKYMNIY